MWQKLQPWITSRNTCFKKKIQEGWLHWLREVGEWEQGHRLSQQVGPTLGNWKGQKVNHTKPDWLDSFRVQ